MTQEVKRNYLEINSLKDLNQGTKPSDDYSLNLLDPINFQLNKFFYKSIGNKHKWVDRLTWTEEQWIDYVSSKNVKTFVLKCKEDLVGFFELIHHQEKKEVEIAYLGILEEYHNKKLGISTDIGKGYRALANISDHGGQEVPHLHFHLFGGETVGKMVV